MVAPPATGQPGLTSQWPLPEDGVRLLLPLFLVKLLRKNRLSRDLYPLAAGFYPTARGHTMQRETHDSNLLMYCTDGIGTLSAADSRWRVKAGDLVVLPRGCAHHYRAHRSNPWSIYWVHYDGELAADYTAFVQQNERPVFGIGVRPHLIAGFEALFSLRRAGYSERAYVHGACELKALLTAMGDQADRADAPGRGRPLDLDRIRNIMHLRINAELHLADLAREAGMSPYHFARRFKQQTGQSPIQHFIHLKMQHACQLLDMTAMPVKQVAAEVGYDDPYYFSRLFKRVIGMSPQYYRRNRSA